MIQPIELRINNFVFIKGHGDNAFKIKEIGSALATVSGGPNFKVAYDEIHPILITTGSLERIGFQIHESGNMATGFGLELTNFTIHKEWKVNKVNCPEQVFIHQLQNLIFALTGKEVEIVP